MPLFFLIILLLAPLADIYLAARWLFASPPAAGLYLAAAMASGALLMKFAKIGVGEAARLLFAGAAPPAAFAGFIKLWLAGALLFFPGYGSDVLAACVLLSLVLRRGAGKTSAASPKIVSEVAAEIVDENARRRD